MGGDVGVEGSSGGSDDGLPPDVFTGAALRLFDLGHHPVPIGRRTNGKPAGKAPWLGGLTGYEGVDVDREQIELWPAQIARLKRKGPEGVLNLGMRLAVGCIGIDVDAYDGRRGLETLAELEARLGPLPQTFRVTARGFECGSGIRLFRIPDGVRLRGELKAEDGTNGHVEIIQRHHRLVAAPPSVHPTGSRYAVYDERTGEKLDEIPPTDDWPELPPAWVEHLRIDGEAGAGGRPSATPAEVERFGAEHVASDHPKLAVAVVNRVRGARVETRNILRDGLCQGARESRGGWYSWSPFCADMLTAADASYAARGLGEFDRQDFGSLVAYAVAQAEADDYDMLLDRLEKRLAGANGWADVETMKRAQGRNSRGKLVTRSYADVQPEKVNWLWPHWLPRGCVAMLEGDPGIGKSEMTVEFAAIVSSGRQWPEVIVDGVALPRKG